MLCWCRAGLWAAARDNSRAVGNSSSVLGRHRVVPSQAFQEGTAPGVSHLPCLSGLWHIPQGPARLQLVQTLRLISVLAFHICPWALLDAGGILEPFCLSRAAPGIPGPRCQQGLCRAWPVIWVSSAGSTRPLETWNSWPLQPVCSWLDELCREQLASAQDGNQLGAVQCPP